jgi:hypothetical protein
MERPFNTKTQFALKNIGVVTNYRMIVKGAVLREYKSNTLITIAV